MNGQKRRNKGSRKTPMAPDCFIETCDICQRLADLEKQIDSFSNIPQDIQQKITTLKTLRNVSHDRLGIKIPVEIINQIFTFVDRTNNSCSTSPGSPLPVGYICYAGILSSVCRRWRDITLAQPELWTNIYINLLKESPDQLDIAKEWLNRSGSLPLNLTLYTPRNEESEDSSAMASMIDLLRLHSVRWEYLDIQFASPDAVYLLFNNLERMPTSKFIDLRVKDYFHDTIVFPTRLQPRRLFSSLSHIEKFVSLGWGNLTHFHMAHSRASLLLKIIGQAPNLKQCIIQHPLSLPKAATLPVTSLSLERLECTVSSPKFFRHITLPSLRHLKYDVRAGRFRSNARMGVLIDFLARSALDSGSLHSFDLELHFYADSPPEYDAIRLFELESLTRLSFEVWGPPELDIHPVLIKLSDNTVFPQLQDLRVLLTGEAALEPSSWSFLCDMVTGHNLRANTMNIDDTQRNLKPSSGTSTDQVPFHQQRNSTLIPSVGTQHRHFLKSISIYLIDRWGNKFQVKARMKKQVLLSLQEAQKVGPLTLEISNSFRDVLQSLRHDGLGEDDIADLQLLPVLGTKRAYYWY